ncbi:hypothetical protein PEBR_02313 [Penicillium brasilianum]|uniref:EthD domain-containing protein n=1 Tax=Penicillium brasilianum TaxID=104259 RepID=A0A1S9S1J3_PENBI|nr:hypothetical protein PEBR_02313 [Penicillium brasilianum]
MHLTILSRKLPTLTNAQFRHEFQVVHSEQTTAIAQNMGIIHQYEQGLALSTLDQPRLEQSALSPMEEAPDYQAFARLTWPSLEVMQGSFSTEDYRRSAGEHIFAEPFRIFLTEPLGNGGIGQIAKDRGSSEGSTIRLIVPIQPSPVDAADTETDFEKRWDEHATFIRSISGGYVRHRSLNVSSLRLEQIFDQTQFDPRIVVTRGGYEEFVFESRVAAEEFFKQHSQSIQDSYHRFVDTTQLEVFVFDCVTRFAADQRGWWQTGAGLVIGTTLRLKVLLGR